MGRPEESRKSRSLALYGMLLELYPRPYLRQHRAEMLQNFQDLERASTSQASLWLFLATDLVGSLRSHLMRSLCGQTAMVVLVLMILLGYTEGHAIARLHPMEGLCSGYFLGWFVGWFGDRWRVSSGSRVPSHIRSLPSQATIIATLLVLAAAAGGFIFGPKIHVIWALGYGFLLAWIAGWAGSRRQRRL